MWRCGKAVCNFDSSVNCKQYHEYVIILLKPIEAEMQGCHRDGDKQTHRVDSSKGY